MKVVIATDSFKNTMRSDEAGSIIGDALRASLRDAKIVVLPMADGGEGTTDAVVGATGGTVQAVDVTGPLGETVTAHFGLLPDGRTAVMEMASASGIELVAPERLNPMKTTTYGTGELFRAVLSRGVRDIVLGIGGSATIDGGLGMSQALGFRFVTADGADCARGGAALASVASIDAEGVVPELAACRIRVACDVTNPLLGKRGAANVFGPQKGASQEMVEELENGLGNLAEVLIREGWLASVDRPGDGAAGGLGAALRGLCNAEIQSGANLVADLTGFDEVIADADLLVTGEGRTDSQTAGGKLCAVVAARARAAGARTILISGTLGDDLGAVDGLFDAVYASVRDVGSLDQAMRRARENLSETAKNVGRALALGRAMAGTK